ncbi:hypothetical protein [Nannocystis punicea]|uniref:MYXO-CTERM domain-containing protein n=1 Tax=Nannocystis punicea TaxID=2995304 RepID=A0ABY7H8T2_9BACT|nr:hypothetical protein [Nannocystis poenicansa]WAS95394.1 hypothetical protein O0S08_04475 [Nannocystis poenicansa]
MRWQLAVLGALALFHAPSVARATCLTRCDVRMVFDDCTSPADDVWPAELPVGLVVACGDGHHSPEDSSAPRERDAGGCVVSVPATQIELSRTSEERSLVPMQAAFREKGACLGWPRFELEQPLSPGAYHVIQPAAFAFRVSDEARAETSKRVPPAALSCYQCWGGGPPHEPPALPPPPPAAHGRAGCDVHDAEGPGVLALCGLALVLGRWRRRARG